MLALPPPGAYRTDINLISRLQEVIWEHIDSILPGYLEAVKDPRVDRNVLADKFLSRYPIARDTEVEAQLRGIDGSTDN